MFGAAVCAEQEQADGSGDGVSWSEEDGRDWLVGSLREDVSDDGQQAHGEEEDDDEDEDAQPLLQRVLQFRDHPRYVRGKATQPCLVEREVGLQRRCSVRTW